MVTVNPDDLMTIGDINAELGYSAARINTLMRDTEPALAIANGRIKFYTRDQVKKALFEANKSMLTFIGYMSPEQSYDVVTEKDA